jgi:uncharacterized protein YjbI with pentapeptide repeats
MNVQALLQAYAQGRRDFSHADLHQADLANVDLVQVGLQQANLTGANLAGANLHQANLRQANLTGANLTGANLSKANLRRANLTAATLADTRLDGAVLLGALLPEGTGVTAPSLENASALAGDESDRREPAIAPALSASLRPAALKTSLPWASLGFLGMSYLCFGIILGVQHGSPLLWAIALGSVLIGQIDESLTLCIPLMAALTTVFTDIHTLLGVFAMGLAGAATIATFIAFKGVMGRSWLAALRDSSVVGAVLAIFSKAYVWLFEAKGNYAWGPLAAPELGSAYLTGLLILGVVCGELGAIAGLQMDREHFSRRQIAGIYLGIAAIGLLVGKCITVMLSFTGPR